ncbi:MAG TPA: hypothetical protein VF509_16155 [Sphingobium sp.]
MGRFAIVFAALVALAGCHQQPRLSAPNDGENAVMDHVENTTQP